MKSLVIITAVLMVLSVASADDRVKIDFYSEAF
jgi:hypothetical protein